MEKRTIILLLVVVGIFTACAEMPPGRGVSIPGATPPIISLELASQVEYKPMSPEELAIPAIQYAIAQCEQKGWKHCREETVSANSRTRFVRTKDVKLWAFVSLGGGLEGDRDYMTRFRLFDPDGNIRLKTTANIHTNSTLPPNFTMTFSFFWTPPDPPKWQLGQWRIEVAVNGQVEIERTFEVSEDYRFVKNDNDYRFVKNDNGYRFVKNDNGVIHDKKTDLEWYVGPDKKTTWDQINAMVKNLKVAGGGWRMPTIKELQTLYQKGVGSRNMTRLLKTTGWWVWSGDTVGKVSALYFLSNGHEYWYPRHAFSGHRGFAVRSRR